MRIERASAQTMAEEMAARWWGKKDLGEARLSPVRARAGTMGDRKHGTILPTRR